MNKIEWYKGGKWRNIIMMIIAPFMLIKKKNFGPGSFDVPIEPIMLVWLVALIN